MAETRDITGQASPQGQPNTNVAPTQQAPTQAETDFSSRMAHLARKEKAFREQQRRDQAERQSWEQQRKAEQARIEAEIYSRYQKDPLGFSQERGISPDQLTSLLLNQTNPQEANLIFQLQQQNKQLQERLDAVDKRFEENQTSAIDGALKQIGYDAKLLINSEPDKYEMISRAGEDGIEAVKAYCKLMWDEEQVAIDVQQAAELVEQELLERSLAFASAKKVAAKLQPSAPAQPEPQQATAQTSKTQQTTSLNSQTLQPGSRPKGLSDADRRRRAILAAQGKDPNN